MRVFACALGSRTMPMESWSVAGASLRVRTGGRGERTILLAVDPPNVLEAYAELFLALGPHARLVAFELPGFGRSTAPRGFKHSWEEQLRILEALAERAGGGAPVALAFPCVAAYAALALAARRRDLVAGLVLMQAPSWEDEQKWMDRIDKRRVLRTPVVGQAAMSLRTEAIAREWFAAAAGDVDKMRPLAALAVESITHDAKFPLASALQAMDKDAPPLAKIDIPALLVWGDSDRTHKRSDPRGLGALLADHRSVVLAGAGHFPELERPREFADAVASFLGEAR